MTRDFVHLLEKAATKEDPARVVNIGSMDGLHIPTVSRTGTYAYTSSKAAVHHLTRNLAGSARSALYNRQRNCPGVFPEPHDRFYIRQIPSGYRGKQPYEARGKAGGNGGGGCISLSKGGAYTDGVVIPVDGKAHPSTINM